MQLMKTAVFLGCLLAGVTSDALAAPWTGSIDTDWNTGGNWDTGTVPGSGVESDNPCHGLDRYACLTSAPADTPDSSPSMVWSQEGQITEARPGWTFTPSENKGGQTYYADEGYYLDRGGKLTGPRIALPDGAFRFFRYTFESISPVRCYWAVDFYDADGIRIRGDCYASIHASNERVQNTCVFYGRVGTASVEPFFRSLRPFSIWNPRLEAISAKEAADWCDAMYKTVPPLAYDPPKGRLAPIPKTMAALRSGTPWRMHILGHSLYNDTYNSNFQALIKRLYPKSNLQVTFCGKGSTGCEFYQYHVQEYVLDYQPDVVIVCGLGHDISEIASVITQIKAALECEIILMSEPFNWDIREHNEDDRTTPLPKQKIDADRFYKELTRKESKGKREMEVGPMEFVELQRQLAEKESIAFLDAKTAWYDYLGDSGKPWEWFHRDRVHANDRGKQVVARILERYFDSSR